MSDAVYDEEREDYANLADEMNDPDVGPWNEADWDERAVANARRYAAREGLSWPPRTGDFDRWYERQAAAARLSTENRDIVYPSDNE